jgi:ArsR family transcriptional regulator
MERGEKIQSLCVLQLKALADETRMRIIQLLASGRLCACDLQASFDISQPTLSYHLKLLSDSGLVDTKREGRWSHYSLNRSHMASLIEFMTESASADNGIEPKQRSRCT